MAKEGLQAPPMPEGAQVPLAPQQPAPHMPPLTWSHFQPKFSGKPEEDAEAH